MLLCYLIGLTYVAKQENLAELRHLWPLAFLGAPFLYAVGPRSSPRGSPPSSTWASSTWVVSRWPGLCAPGRRDIRRAVASLIAGISLLDALLIAGAGDPSRAGMGRSRLRPDPGRSALGARHLKAAREIGLALARRADRALY